MEYKGKNTGLTKEEALNQLCEFLYNEMPNIDFKNQSVYILFLESMIKDTYWTDYEKLGIKYAK